MTKSRKISLALVVTLVFALLATSILPLLGVGGSTASAVTVTPRDEWTNTYSGSYYDNLNTGITGTSFRSALANLITTTHTHLTQYDDFKQLYYETDADPDNNGNIIWFYTGTSVPFYGTWDSGSYPTNREHVWPKNAGKAFPEKTGPGGDAHHIRPLNSSLNSTRSSMSFGEMTPGASGVRIVAQNGSTSYGNLCYTNGSLFYPGVGYRGATARILFYLQTRWGDMYDLTFVDSAGSNKTIGKISDLMKWHLEEPPTDEEIRRNEVVFGIQGNRNPFIDHPEYAEMIYCYDGKSYNSTLQNVVSTYGSYLNGNVTPDPTPDTSIPTSLTLSPSQVSLTVGSTAAITVTAAPATASNSVTWSSSDSSVATVSSSGVITAVAKGTATVTATSTKDTSVKATVAVTVGSVPLTGLTISPNTYTLNEGTGVSLTVKPTPQNASAAVTWSSSNNSVAKVDGDGYVTAVGAGTATITATSVEFPSITATATVTVNAAAKPKSIEISGTPVKKNYVKGDTFDPTGLTVKVTNDDGTFKQYSDTAELLLNFKWLDGVTKQATLSEGTTQVICKFGELEATVSGITVTDNVTAFLRKMEKIESKSFDSLSLQEQYSDIKEAISYYNALSAEEKNLSTVVGKYATLRSAAQAYNDAVSGAKGDFEEAVSISAGTLTKAVSSAIAALIVLVRGLLWR